MELLGKKSIHNREQFGVATLLLLLVVFGLSTIHAKIDAKRTMQNCEVVAPIKVYG
jgi:hypothetical protein